MCNYIISVKQCDYLNVISVEALAVVWCVSCFFLCFVWPCYDERVCSLSAGIFECEPVAVSFWLAGLVSLTCESSCLTSQCVDHLKVSSGLGIFWGLFVWPGWDSTFSGRRCFVCCFGLGLLKIQCLVDLSLQSVVSLLYETVCTVSVKHACWLVVIFYNNSTK